MIKDPSLDQTEGPKEKSQEKEPESTSVPREKDNQGSQERNTIGLRLIAFCLDNSASVEETYAVYSDLDDDILYKFKEGDFHRLRIQDIEDMLLLLVQGKVDKSHLKNVLHLMSPKNVHKTVLSSKRVEDLQLGVVDPHGFEGQLKMVVEVPDSSWLTRSIATCST
ncbi:hypothetical protein Tco_0401561 [Tanacetum coccineum]